MSGLTSGAIGIVGAALIALPADAANLQFWRFDPQQNRLTFTTDTQIRPSAQLIFNPTRLVIDLPN
ncbi:MAG: AMIN domain-containing protein, partial [Cyanobacteria bacterium P01_D01_bin.2]